MRPDDTAARGTRMNMNTAVRTANRIWVRYCRNAVRLPIGSAPLVDANRAEPHRGDVERLKIAVIDRDRDREQPADSELRVEEVAAGRLEPRLLVPRPYERPDDSDAGERLAHDLVDPVELDLGGPEQRDRPGHHEPDHEAHQRHHDDEQPGQRDVGPERP